MTGSADTKDFAFCVCPYWIRSTEMACLKACFVVN